MYRRKFLVERQHKKTIQIGNTKLLGETYRVITYSQLL